MFKFIRNLFKNNKLETEMLYQERKMDYLYHMLLALSRSVGIKPEELAEKQMQREQNIVYLSELFKSQKGK